GGDDTIRDQRELVFAADELRSRTGDQLGRHRQAGGLFGWSPHHTAGGDRLGEPLQVEQPYELELEAPAAPTERADEIGAQDLLGCGNALEPYRFDHRGTEDVVVAAHDVARRDADAQRDHLVYGTRAGVGIEALLDRDAGGKRI